MIQTSDVVIIGAGAAGLMCAITAGQRGRRVLVIDHANKAGKKILMSGGGRCNFTNYHIHPDAYLSHNPHFCKSALSRYTQWDFIDLVKRHRIPFHEKTLGQLFCDDKSHAILQMLLDECKAVDVTIQLNTSVTKIDKVGEHTFNLATSSGTIQCESLVIASGGLSIPTMGASPFGYQVATQFGLSVWPTRAGLVPLTLQPADKDKLSVLSGISVDSCASTVSKSFREHLLFTHRGLSGPAILQLSSYWEPGQRIVVNMLPEINLFDYLQAAKVATPNKQLKTVLHPYLPKRLVTVFLPEALLEKQLATISHQALQSVAQTFVAWSLIPNGTEGYRTAEVTLGGVDCDALSSKTLAARDVAGLYFVGEVVDVTGWLGGYNFQWAWSSGWAAGQVV